MPTKPNRAGQQQNYVPQGNGDASGEYADHASGSNIHFTNFKKPDETPEKVEVEVKEEKKVEKVDPAQHEDLNNYLLKSHGNGSELNEFGKAIKDNFDVGTDDAKSLVNNAVKNGVQIHYATGISNYSGAVNLSGISKFGEYSSKHKGDTFYHEFWHCFDNIYAKGTVDKDKNPTITSLLTEEDKKHVLENTKVKSNSWWNFDATPFLLQNNLSTCKVLSNGKTMLETLKAECHALSLGEKKGKMSWHKMISDYNQEVESEVEKMFPNYKEKLAAYHKAEQQYKDEALKLYPSWKNGGSVYDSSAWDKRKEYIDQKMKESGFENFIDESIKVDVARNKIRTKLGRAWMSMSDMYGIHKKVPYGFCGGHKGNYSTDLKGAIALEFMAEYGSARSLGENGKRTLALFQKYFPETSKMCEELQNMVLAHHKKGGKG